VVDSADLGWGHYDSCPLARDQETTIAADCCCDDLAAEYADEDPWRTRAWEWSR